MVMPSPNPGLANVVLSKNHLFFGWFVHKLPSASWEEEREFPDIPRFRTCKFLKVLAGSGPTMRCFILNLAPVQVTVVGLVVVS